MRPKCLLALALLSIFSQNLIADEIYVPNVSEERVVLRTIAGDIVVALYPEIAPKTSEQFLRLVRSGLYDTTHFFRVEPNFVMQTSNQYDRLIPLTPDQRRTLSKIPLEVDSRVKHRAGVLSMAHEDGDPNSAEVSFSILLADSPHLDGKYTVFGHVERGFEVIGKILTLTRDVSHHPKARVTIERAEVAGTQRELATMSLSGVKEVVDPGRSGAGSENQIRAVAAIGFGGVAILFLLSLTKMFSFSHAQFRSLIGIGALVTSFLGLCIVPPLFAESAWIGLATFSLLFLMFRRMSQFEM